EFVMLARRDPTFRATLNRAALNIPDGIGLVMAARLAGKRLREHVQGTDLVLMLAAESARAGQRWFLLGGEDAMAARAARARPALGAPAAFRMAAPTHYAALAVAAPTGAADVRCTRGARGHSAALTLG